MNKRNYIALAAAMVLAVGLATVRIKDRPADMKKEVNEGAVSRSRATAVAGVLLNNCRDDRLEMLFLCDYAWEKKNAETDAVVYIVAEEPAVTMKMIKIDADVHFIQQLGRDKLEAIGQYREGFVTEEAKVAGFKAIKVKAFAKEDPSTRLSDYYFVRDRALYAVMFSVTPKEEWDSDNFVFNQIVDSVKF